MTTLADSAALDAASMLSLLRDAAQGRVPERDLEDAQNPLKWATDWSRAVADAGATAALGEAVAVLVGSPHLSEVEVARAVQSATRTAPPEALWAGLRGHVEAGRAEAAVLVAQAAAQTHAAIAGLPLVLDAYVLALEPSTPDEARAWIMRAIGRADPDWILANPEWVLHPDPETARRRVADALGGLRSDRMAQQFDRLSAIATARGTPMPTAVSDTIAAMVKARSAAGL